MSVEKASIDPFKPVLILMNKIVNRFFSAKNRERDLKGYGYIYLAFKDFHEKVVDLMETFEKGMVENQILVEPRQTLYLRDIEQKIEAIPSETPTDKSLEDISTSDIVVFQTSKMTKEDFAFLRSLK